MSKRDNLKAEILAALPPGTKLVGEMLVLHLVNPDGIPQVAASAVKHVDESEIPPESQRSMDACVDAVNLVLHPLVRDGSTRRIQLHDDDEPTLNMKGGVA